ncbi:ABC transporter permease subunit, partial [Phytoactinopolyspora endophytica]|uniref:ABC transporter permease subunit n=1 Tax=Phytoactinopolyspora endophytica TaxID=1642495 RepID=UPI00197B9F1B
MRTDTAVEATSPADDTLQAPRPARRGRTVRRVAAVVMMLLPLVIVPLDPLRPQFTWSATNSAYSLATAAAVFGILAYGIAVLLRFLGLASMGHGALFGVGAYASALGLEKLGLGFSLSLLLALAVTAAVGTAVGALALRMSGMAFLIITIALGELLVL